MSGPLLAEVLAEALYGGPDDDERDEDYEIAVRMRLAADPRTVEAIAEALHDRAGTHSVRPTRMLCDGPRHHMRDAGVIRDALFGRPK